MGKFSAGRVSGHPQTRHGSSAFAVGMPHMHHTAATSHDARSVSAHSSHSLHASEMSRSMPTDIACERDISEHADGER